MEEKENKYWFVDIFKIVYDLTTNCQALLDIWMKKVIFRTNESVYREKRPFICINDSWGSTNSRWIRSHTLYFEIYAENLEKAEAMKDALVYLFNRANFNWIRSRLSLDVWFWFDEKWFVRHSLYFDFVFKDQNF